MFSRIFQDLQRPNSRLFQDPKTLFFQACNLYSGIRDGDPKNLKFGASCDLKVTTKMPNKIFFLTANVQ